MSNSNDIETDLGIKPWVLKNPRPGFNSPLDIGPYFQRCPDNSLRLQKVSDSLFLNVPLYS